MTIVLGSADVTALLPMSDCIAAVEGLFVLHARGAVATPAMVGVPARDGGFHIKAATAEIEGSYFAAKVNANFPGNGTRFSLPTIQGILLLFNAENGSPLAIMDSSQITAIRTAAATGVAAKYLARRDASTVTICGCGAQSRSQLQALISVRPIATVFAYDRDPARAGQYAEFVRRKLNLNAQVATTLREATLGSDITVTCTTARTHFLGLGDIRSGSFVAAVGADNEEKQELSPELLASSKLVVDILEQCASIGDLHHALAARAMTRADVHAELGQVAAGVRPGRTDENEIIVFDSTGTALQDVAAAALVYRKAIAAGRGQTVSLA